MPPFGSAPRILQLGGIMEVSLRYGNFFPIISKLHCSYLTDGRLGLHPNITVLVTGL